MSDGMRPLWRLDVVWPGTGKVAVYDLAQPLAPGMPHHPYHPPFGFTLTKQHGELVTPSGVSGAAEMITLGGHAGTHVDAPSHIARDGVIHGGRAIAEGQSYTGGMDIGGIHEVPPLIAAGHLVDVPALLGRDLTPADRVGRAELERWFADRSLPEPGDVVLVRTGWARHWEDHPRYLGTYDGVPGVSLDGAEWLAEKGVVAAGSDTVAFEPMPCPTLEVHSCLLVDNGILIIESLNLERAAGDGLTEFLFVATPLPIQGGTASPIRPLAVVGA